MHSDTALRDPNEVTHLARLGSAHAHRLSFMRVLLRRLKRENWRFSRHRFEIDASGVGRAVYLAAGPERTYALVAFAHDLPDELRSDRVIAEAWDTTFCLHDGVPTDADLDRLAANVPKQEAGRISGRELSLSRANRSVRLFKTVIDALSRGQQPDADELMRVGYLMRTTAVYGSGKFGAADRDAIAGRAEFTSPFQVELLNVYLIRAFTVDLVEHMAMARGGDNAVALDPALRRTLGVGNSTGLGMAPFLVNHPRLTHAWLHARETALARVRALPTATQQGVETFVQFLRRAQRNADTWHSEHPVQQPKIASLVADLNRLSHHLDSFDWQIAQPWNALWRWAESALGLEGQEQLLALMLEPHGVLVDDLADRLSTAEPFPALDARGTVGSLQAFLDTHYAWALSIDHTSDTSRARFWYVSEEKLEPRLGERFDEPGAEREQPLGISWQIRQLAEALAACDPDLPLADFLARHPEHRHTVRRAQLAPQHPYMEVRDNLLDATMLPIDLLRVKLAFFGANRFDPRSDRWLRITMFQHAPYPHELQAGEADDWCYPRVANA
ncbi:MAG: hypothetical protein AAGA11_12595 [Pseudomonadota bacterium]